MGYKRRNKDKKEYPQGRQVLKMCNDANLIITTGIAKLKRCEAKIDDMSTEFTFENGIGSSTIDYCIINEQDLNIIEETVIDDDIWEYCNTSHRAVIVQTNLSLKKGKIKKEEKKKGRRDKKINNI